MGLGDYLSSVRALSRDANGVARKLELPEGQRVVNVHEHGLKAFEAFARMHYEPEAPVVGVIAMNPGKNGGVQTGIPFTDLDLARQLVSDIDTRLDRPSGLPAPHRELSGRRLLRWGLGRFGDAATMHRTLCFYITCPLAILEGDPPKNVPLPALSSADRRLVEALIDRHAQKLVRTSRARALVLLGRYAQQVDARMRQAWPDAPAAFAAPHPAARMTTRAFERELDDAVDRARTAAGVR